MPRQLSLLASAGCHRQGRSTKGDGVGCLSCLISTVVALVVVGQDSDIEMFSFYVHEFKSTYMPNFVCYLPAEVRVFAMNFFRKVSNVHK